MKYEISKKISLVGIMLLASQVAFAEPGGTSIGGGGDTTIETRIDEIRIDLLKWVNEGGAKGLQLPANMNLTQYNSQMSDVLARQEVVVSAVSTAQENSTQDPELKVRVNGQPKTCRGFISRKDGRKHILCNIERFQATSESNQYVLIHHEYAGLANVEKNVGASSDYQISNQITDYLTHTLVLKLAVKRSDTAIQYSDSTVRCLELTPQQRATVGQRCVTTKGVIFQRVGLEQEHFGEAWQEKRSGWRKDGPIWSDAVDGTYTQYNAVKVCKNIGGTLPTKEEFEQGEASGFREVLPHMNDQVFWSKSVYPMFLGYGEYAAIFHSGLGRTGDGFSRDYDFAVRCISKI